MTEKILITSALPYVNNIPHLGNLIGAVLSADVFARFARLRHGKENVLYICGADEHGTTTEAKAKEEGLEPQALCDKYTKLHEGIYDWFNISFDKFGRTSAPNHIKITQDIFNKVLANGFVKEDVIVQPYCVACEKFLADRFIEGECPHCQYADARGDQCDNCGKLLNPQELVKPRCKTDGSAPEFRETKHLFLALDDLQPQLEQWVGEQSVKGAWTQNAIRTTQAWFKEGLKKRAITRDLKWGISIPRTAFGGRYSDKVFYVWFDAPIGYISITEQLLGEGYTDWWQDKNVKLYQFMGKDNIPFHSIIFPATIMASGDEFIKVHHLNSTEYLNYEHTQFSKSRGVGVFGDNAQESGVPSDVFRYALLYNRPEGSDTQFTWNGLQERLNNELVANFGNFVNRTLTFTQRFFDGEVVAVKDLDEATQAKVDEFQAGVQKYLALLDAVKLRDALMQFMQLSSLANGFFQEAAPWKSRTEDEPKAKRDLAILVNWVKDLAILIEPYLPDTSKNIFGQLATEHKGLDDLGTFSVVGKIGTPEILFKKLEDEDVVVLKEKYGGEQQNADKEKVKNTMEKNPSDLDLRVGKIIEVLPHPNAEKLYIEKVSFGEEETQIISGLVGHYTPEELLGKHIIVAKNLKPAKLRGEWSNGMLLAAEDAQGTVAIVTAPQAVLGSRVSVAENASAPLEQLDINQFFTHSFALKDGKVLIDEQEMQASGTSLVIDKGVLNGKIS